MAFQSELSVFFGGEDDDVPRGALRHDCKRSEPRLAVVPVRKLIQLRDYQQEAIDSCLKDLETHRSSLIVLATGLGKTILFCKLVEHWTGRVLVLAHLEELLQNARDDLMAIVGEPVGIERSRERHEGERIVVSLIQSMRSRLKHYRRDHYSLIIVDEAHHAASADYRKVLEYFSSAKVVGLTATDGRADGASLPFDTVSYRMGIREGINEGYLVPVRGKRVIIDAINLSRVRRKNDGEGDFDDSALDDEMVKGASAIADVLVSDYPFEKGILFFPGCASAKFTAELLNQREPDSAVYIDGTITGEQRRELVRTLKTGGARWLCNVGIATEGFNWPDASVVGMCTPTLSRPAYVQRVGRGTRPLEGLLNGLSTTPERKAAIAGSNKPTMLILDFQGVSANLDLITHETFMEESRTEEDSFLLQESEESTEQEEPEIPEDSFLDGPNLNLRAIARGIQSSTVHTYDEFDPFEASGERQKGLELQSELGKVPPISHKQYRQLCKYGVNDESLTKVEAQKLIGFIASKGWRLWKPEMNVLQDLYKNIIAAREDSFV